MYVDITWQCELVLCNVQLHVKECRADISNIVVVTARKYLPCTTGRLSASGTHHFISVPYHLWNVQYAYLLYIVYIFFKYPFKGVACSFLVFIHLSICLPVAVITDFCTTVNGQTIALSTVPSYHILVMIFSKGYGPFCILLCFEVFYQSHLLMRTLSTTFCIN
jgi:hypothetical protein